MSGTRKPDRSAKLLNFDRKPSKEYGNPFEFLFLEIDIAANECIANKNWICVQYSFRSSLRYVWRIQFVHDMSFKWVLHENSKHIQYIMPFHEVSRRFELRCTLYKCDLLTMRTISAAVHLRPHPRIVFYLMSQ